MKDWVIGLILLCLLGACAIWLGGRITTPAQVRGSNVNAAITNVQFNTGTGATTIAQP